MLAFCYCHNKLVTGLHVALFWGNHARNFKSALHYALDWQI